MRRAVARLVAATLMALANAGSGSALSPVTPPLPADISPYVLTATANGASTPVLVVLHDQADLRPAALLSTKSEKGRFVYDALRWTALRSQAPLRAELDRAGIRYHAFYLVNMIELTGDRDLILKLAARPDVARIEANPQISNLETLSNPKSEIQSLQSVEWNIQQINAPAVWAMGYTGQGVVVAGQDTGYQWNHPALLPHYRGWNGVTVTHDYNWHDAIHDSVGNPCGNDSPAPCDDQGHGTHTMGTMVGDDGAGNQVGVAPGAEWMGCRNMDRGFGTPARYTECFEFFLAPYPIGGDPLTQGVPSLAPAVIGNSWSCPASEGCESATLQSIVERVRAAGIEVVAAAQNYGPGCSTVSEPIGIYTSTFTVGATDPSDAIASFSSRGPVTSDGSGSRKPDISAPGVNIRSSVPGGTYAGSGWSGTSMATPHVVGLFALVWSAAPGLLGNLAATERVITSTALHRTTTQGCGGDTPTSVPNNVFGWGRIDALAAVQAARPALQIAATASAHLIPPGGPLMYTLVVANPSQFSPDSGVVVTDTLPLSVTFSSASDAGVYSPAARMVTWVAPALAAQTSLTFTLGVTVSSVPTGTWIVNGDYGARSDQVMQVVGGPPATTVVGSFPYAAFLPVIFAPTWRGGPMKRVVSISLGSASRDHRVEMELLGQRVLIERIGADGDAVRAAQMFADLDGQVDALGMGGIDLGLQVGDRWYPLHGAFKLVEKVSKTPVVDGGGLKATLEARVMQFVQARIGDEISPKRAIVTAGTDRFGMGASFVAAGYDTVFCDFMFALGLPIPIRGLNNVERLAAILLPILGRLPIDMIYPTGAKQEQIVPKFVKWYAWASVIGGDCHYIKRHLPARLDGKVIVTNTTTPADVQLFRSRGVKYLVTTTPNLDGRTFGTNVMEGVLVALAGKGRKLAPSELSEMMAQLHWEPTIQKLEPG